jgi:uncharacterized protein
MRWLCGLVLLVAVQGASAGFAEGLAAYERGDFATALAEWQPLAEQGDDSAQYNLALMYRNGQGVPQDYAQAQYNLGYMYDNGQGIPQDNAEAYALFSIAAAAGNKHAVKGRDIVAKKLTPEALQKAQARAKLLWAKWSK